MEGVNESCKDGIGERILGKFKGVILGQSIFVALV